MDKKNISKRLLIKCILGLRVHFFGLDKDNKYALEINFRFLLRHRKEYLISTYQLYLDMMLRQAQLLRRKLTDEQKECVISDFVRPIYSEVLK